MADKPDDSLQVGSVQHTITSHHRSETTLLGDFNDPTFTGDDCAGEGLTEGQCKLKTCSRFGDAISFTGMRNLRLARSFKMSRAGARPLTIGGSAGLPASSLSTMRMRPAGFSGFH